MNSILKFIFIAVFTGGGLFAFYGCFFYSMKELEFESKSKITNGIVTGLEDRKSSFDDGSESMYYPVVNFTLNGQSYTFTNPIGSDPPAYEKGEKVEVQYDPNAPSNAMIKGFLSQWFLPMILGIFGIIFTGTGVILFFVFRGGFFNTPAWEKKSEIIQADFDRIEHNKNIIRYNMHPFFIHCSWKDPKDGNVYKFRSIPIWTDPKPYLKTRSTIDVKVNQQNREYYSVDISFVDGYHQN